MVLVRIGCLVSVFLGNIFMHRIVSCLVLATSPTAKHIGSAPYYESGLVVGNKSYRPKGTEGRKTLNLHVARLARSPHRPAFHLAGNFLTLS